MAAIAMPVLSLAIPDCHGHPQRHLSCTIRTSPLRAVRASGMQSSMELGPVLLVGVTGGTGGSVVNIGLVARGVDTSQMRVLTRSPDGAAARNLGVQAIGGDMDDPSSVNEALKGELIAKSL